MKERLTNFLYVSVYVSLTYLVPLLNPLSNLKKHTFFTLVTSSYNLYKIDYVISPTSDS